MSDHDTFYIEKDIIGGGGNSAQVQNWSLLSHSPQDPRINIVNLKLVVKIKT